METPSLFSYVLKIDDGAAPNPFWGLCTLTICKPVIRRNAKIGDWVIGTGSKNSKTSAKDKRRQDFSEHLCYAMKVIEIMSLKEYDEYCQKSLKNKIPKIRGSSYNYAVGDCIYDFSDGTPKQRLSVHNEGNMATDLNGKNALLSNQFYYFGENPVFLPLKFHGIIKRNQGHRKITDQKLISDFEDWVTKFKLRKPYGPMYKLEFNFDNGRCLSNKCASRHLQNDLSNLEEEIC